MKPRRFDAEVKMAAVLEVLKGQSRVREACRKLRVSETVFYQWRDKFLEGGQQAFVNGTPPVCGAERLPVTLKRF